MSSFIQAVLDRQVNLSIISLPITLFFAGLPHWYSIYKAQANKVQGGWSNENPRAFVARLNARAAAGKTLTDLEEMILRGQAAQQNGFEWWAVWAVAVLFGYLAKIPKAEMDRWTLMHLATRLIYNYLYVTTKSRAGSYLRTVTFWASIHPAVAIFFKASMLLNV